MNRALIVAMICLNVVLIAALVGVNLNQAQAQTERGENDYIMATGKIGADFDAVYVVDLKTRQMKAWRFDKAAKRLVPYKGRTLTEDFK